MIYSRTPTGCNTTVDSKTLQPLSSCNLLKLEIFEMSQKWDPGGPCGSVNP